MVQLLAEILAHLIYFGDCVLELNIRIFRVVKAYSSEEHQLFFHYYCIVFSLNICLIDTFYFFKVSEPSKRSDLGFESTQVGCIVLHAPVKLN